jgi:hypothetical protein
LDENGIKVFVEHGDFGPETREFIHGIASDAWFGEVDPEDPEYHKKMNPTQRYWRKRKHPKTPDIHMTKGRIRFIPPEKMCLLGPDPQYELVGDDPRWQHEQLKTHPACKCQRYELVGDDPRWQHEQLKTHPACKCQRCTAYHNYSSEGRKFDNFWKKTTDRIQVNV